MRLFNLQFNCIARFFSTIVHCLCDPCYEAAALMFTQIFVNNIPNAKPYEYRDAVNMASKEKANAGIV